VLPDKPTVAVDAHDKLKSDNWQLKNKQIADANEWSVAHEKVRKMLDSKGHELTQARETIAAQAKEPEVARQAQSEMEALRKELADTRQALAVKEADDAQLEDSNGRLNDALAMAMSERKWLLKKGVSLVKEAVRDSKEMCDVVMKINRFSNLLGYQQGLAKGWRIRGEGTAVSAAVHYDPDAHAKLEWLWCLLMMYNLMLLLG
jgi:hypothetical protein